MLHIVTPCSRTQNLSTIQSTIPIQSKWIICHSSSDIVQIDNAIILQCTDTGFVGIKARNYVLDNYPFKDDDLILFHDDDNIIHPNLYKTIGPYLEYDFSIMCWGQINKDESVRLAPSFAPKIYEIDTACYLVRWKYNKLVRHIENTYIHDGLYAEQCAQNGPILTINHYISYYNYLR